MAPPGDSKKVWTVGCGAVFAEMGAKPDLDTIRVTHVIGAYDAGRIANSRLARSQALGGMNGGIGMALFGEAEGTSGSAASPAPRWPDIGCRWTPTSTSSTRSSSAAPSR